MEKKFCEIDKNGYFVKIKDISLFDNLYDWMKELDDNGGLAAQGYEHSANDVEKNKPSDCVLAIPPQRPERYDIKWKNNKWVYEEKIDINIPNDIRIDNENN